MGQLQGAGTVICATCMISLPLNLSSRRRYALQASAGKQQGAGPAWLLQALYDEFGIDKRVFNAAAAAPRGSPAASLSPGGRRGAASPQHAIRCGS